MAVSGAGEIRVATDVGGTFTDLVYFVADPETAVQKIVTAKAATTPPFSAAPPPDGARCCSPATGTRRG